MSKTTQVRPARSSRPPVCLSDESGRVARSSRKSVRRASTGAWVSAAKKRESAEREGNRSRSRPGHERDGKRLEPLVKRLQRAFATDGIAEKHREKVDHLIANASPPRKTHPLTDPGEDTVLAQMRRHQHDFAKPGRGRGNGCSRGLDDYRSISDTGHTYLLEGMGLFFPLKEAHFYSCLLPVSSSLRIAWVIGNNHNRWVLFR